MMEQEQSHTLLSSNHVIIVVVYHFNCSKIGHMFPVQSCPDP